MRLLITLAAVLFAVIVIVLLPLANELLVLY